jgi:hypothetical protein
MTSTKEDPLEMTGSLDCARQGYKPLPRLSSYALARAALRPIRQIGCFELYPTGTFDAA